MDQVLHTHGGVQPLSLAFLALSLGTAGCGATKAMGAGGSSGVGATAQTTGATTSSKAASTTEASSSTGTPFVCNPAAAAGSLYEKSANEFATLTPISMCQYRGDVLLIVDTASQ